MGQWCAPNSLFSKTWTSPVTCVEEQITASKPGLLSKTRMSPPTCVEAKTTSTQVAANDYKHSRHSLIPLHAQAERLMRLVWYHLIPVACRTVDRGWPCIRMAEMEIMMTTTRMTTIMTITMVIIMKIKMMTTILTIIIGVTAIYDYD